MPHCHAQLSPSEELGDLFKGAGDQATALACYQSTGSTVKVVEGAPSQPSAQHDAMLSCMWICIATQALPKSSTGHATASVCICLHVTCR